MNVNLLVKHVKEDVKCWGKCQNGHFHMITCVQLSISVTVVVGNQAQDVVNNEKF